MNVRRDISYENSRISWSKIQDGVANLCRISDFTIRKLLTEERKMGENETFSTPGKIRSRIKQKK